MTDQILKLLGNKRGYDVLRNPLLNKGSAFTPVERVKLGLDGILPPQFNDMAMQAQRSYEGIRRPQRMPIDQLRRARRRAAGPQREHSSILAVVRDHIEEFHSRSSIRDVGQAERV
jgi:malate dehydrogenase (oxaloacetate-decarboxylating)